MTVSFHFDDSSNLQSMRETGVVSTKGRVSRGAPVSQAGRSGLVETLASRIFQSLPENLQKQAYEFQLDIDTHTSTVEYKVIAATGEVLHSQTLIEADLDHMMLLLLAELRRWIMQQLPVKPLEREEMAAERASPVAAPERRETAKPTTKAGAASSKNAKPPLETRRAKNREEVEEIDRLQELDKHGKKRVE